MDNKNTAGEALDLNKLEELAKTAGSGNTPIAAMVTMRHFQAATNPAAILELITLARAGIAADAGQKEGAGEVDAMSQAARDVLAERRRQVEAEGWTPAKDDRYAREELRSAALCYMRWKDITKPGVVPGAWPWSEQWWKPTADRRNLVKAGALIVAEIERLDRAAQPKDTTDTIAYRAKECWPSAAASQPIDTAKEKN